MRVYHYYSAEEKQFFKDYSYGHSREETRQEFNRRFGIELTKAQCEKQIKLAGGTGRTGRFESGSAHAYKSNKCNGTESLYNCKKGPEWRVKVDGKWVRKKKYIWEKEYGSIPDDKLLLFRDGNPENCTLDNLILVDKAVSLEMSRLDYHKTKDDVHMACIATAMVNAKIREMEKKNGSNE